MVAGLRLAVEHGHTDLVRHIFDHGLVDSSNADYNAIAIAAKYGHRAIIQLTLDRVVQLSMQDLTSALKGSLSLLMTKFLLDRNIPLTSIDEDEYGVTTTHSIPPTVEDLCCKSIHVPFGDSSPVCGNQRVLALVFSAREMRQQIPEFMNDNCVEPKKVFEILVKHCLILPTEPIPYPEIVKRCVAGWSEVINGRGRNPVSSTQLK
ncbi:hypothetical protein G6011_11360 [Alternaria panax]|uniref:Ankyrin repeat protein n=1 Tax=Alternaria panax TaxID=48097 RepID=A0AAD4ID95_9PLEO|nr:hypothetical protein G6011_11360 [Alternaria panax]